MPPQYFPESPPDSRSLVPYDFEGPTASPSPSPSPSPGTPEPTTLVPEPLADTITRYKPPKHALKNAVTEVINQLPVVRAIEFRPDRFITSVERSGNVQALLGYERGSEAPSPCAKCRTGRGVFPKCVILNGHFGGSCTNCRVQDQTNKCSFHFVDVNNLGGCVKRKAKIPSAPKAKSTPQAKSERAEEELDDIDSDFSEPSQPLPRSQSSRSRSRKLEDNPIVDLSQAAGHSKTQLADAIQAADEVKLWSIILNLCRNIPDAKKMVVQNLLTTAAADTIYVDESTSQQQLERALSNTLPTLSRIETHSSQKRKSMNEDGTEANYEYKRRVVNPGDDSEAPICEVCGGEWK